MSRMFRLLLIIPLLSVFLQPVMGYAQSLKCSITPKQFESQGTEVFATMEQEEVNACLTAFKATSVGRGLMGLNNEAGQTVLVVDRLTDSQTRIVLDTPPTSAQKASTLPYLEPGFPRKTYETGGTYHAGQSVNELVGDLDGDGKDEICHTGLAIGGLYCWNDDGSLMSGWPTAMTGAAYATMGQFDLSSAGLEVGMGTWGGIITILNDDGTYAPGWPREASNFITSPGTAADLNGDGLDEWFIAEEDGKLHSYSTDGTIPSNWTQSYSAGGQEFHTPSVAWSGDKWNILTASGRTSPTGVVYYNFGQDGKTQASWTSEGQVDTFFGLADFNQDGEMEAVYVALKPNPWTDVVQIRRLNGELISGWDIEGVTYSAAPAIADLDGNGPDIIIQTDDHLYAFHADGTLLPGWPQTFSYRWTGNGAPVVGDVNGDLKNEIVITTGHAGDCCGGDLRVYTFDGKLLPNFPLKMPIGMGRVPALGDIDQDGRMEIAVGGSYWDGYSGWIDSLWVFDLGGQAFCGPEWGQFGNNPQHTGVYVKPECKVPHLEVSPASISETLEFGSSLTRTITLSNTGSAPLTYTVGLDWAAPWITVSGSVSGTLKTDQVVTLTAEIRTPAAHGEYNVGILVNSNDPVNRQINIPIKLSVLTADITILPMNLDVSLKPGEGIDKAIDLKNNSQDVALVWSIGTNTPSWLNLSDNSGTIDPGKTQRVGLGFIAPQKVGDYEIILEVTSNDPVEPSLKVVIHLHVLPQRTIYLPVIRR